MLHHDIRMVRIFTDKNIGRNYFTEQDLRLILDKSKGTSFLAKHNTRIVGIRLTYAPGQWIGSFSKRLSQDKWGVSPEKTAYFQSLFIDPVFSGRGIGPALSQKSIEALKKQKTEAIVCHSWLESPRDSSMRYLTKLGFKTVETYDAYWSDKDYLCTGCNTRPCSCSAAEMILEL